MILGCGHLNYKKIMERAQTRGRFSSIEATNYNENLSTSLKLVKSGLEKFWCKQSYPGEAIITADSWGPMKNIFQILKPAFKC